MASKLHEGSRWEGDAVVEDDGVRICLHFSNSEAITIVDSFDHSAAYADDLLAAIRRTKLDPLAIAAAELVNVIRMKANNWCGDTAMVELRDICAELEKLEELLP